MNERREVGDVMTKTEAKLINDVIFLDGFKPHKKSKALDMLLSMDKQIKEERDNNES